MKYLGIINTMVIMEAESKKRGYETIGKAVRTIAIGFQRWPDLMFQSFRSYRKSECGQYTHQPYRTRTIKKGNFFRCEHQIRILDAESN